MTLNVADCGSNMGPFGNIVTATAMSPGDSILMDTSANGSDPDPNGDNNPDEADTTFIMFGENPSVGTAKRLVQVTNLPDGSSDVIFEFNIENFGDVDLDSIQLIDDLGLNFAPCQITILAITSDDFTVNVDFDGINDIELLDGTDDLPVGDKGAVLLEINVSDCGGLASFENTATVTALSPGDSTLTDESVDGSNPDPNGDGNPDEMSPTVIEFEQSNSIGLAKRIVNANLNSDGSLSVIYEFNIENFGSTIIDSIQVLDNLATTFNPCTSIEIVELTSDDFNVNVNYDGVSDINLLTGFDDIEPGDVGGITLEILVDSCGGDLGPFSNSATICGVGPDVATNRIEKLTDVSTDGSDPDPNGDGNPDEDVPTVINFDENPAMGVAKRISEGPELDDNQNYVFTYEIRVENLGDVNLDSLQVVDDLAQTFANADTFCVLSIESEEFTVNTMFDGVNDMNLLQGTDILFPQNEGAIYLKVKVAPGADMGPYENTATGQAVTPIGTPIMDDSDSGADPSGNNPGEPGDTGGMDDPTPVTLPCFVEIICPDVPDTISTPNDPGWCRAIVNIPDAIPVTCAGASTPEIEFLLEGQGAEGLPLNTWIPGQPSGYEYIVGVTKVNIRAISDIGISDTCMFFIEVLDKEVPVAVCQDVQVIVDGDCEFWITPELVDGGSTDNCEIDTLLISIDGTTFVDSILVNGDDLDPSQTSITLLVRDTSGNESICVADIEVLDFTEPEVVCPPDMTIATEPGVCYGTIPNLLPVDASDNCGEFRNIEQIPVAGTLFGAQAGDTIAVCIVVEDTDFNTDTCKTILTLVDVEAPMWLNCPRPVIREKVSWPDQCGAIVGQFSPPIATDNCVLDTIIQVDTVGLTSGDMFPVGTTILKWVAVDESGNVSDTCEFKVIVDDPFAPTLECPNDTVVIN
ncbi:MAG: HYR domain-containing protein, partial [Bacteroidota bacterium]